MSRAVKLIDCLVETCEMHDRVAGCQRLIVEQHEISDEMLSIIPAFVGCISLFKCDERFVCPKLSVHKRGLPCGDFDAMDPHYLFRLIGANELLLRLPKPTVNGWVVEINQIVQISAEFSNDLETINGE